MAPVRAMGFRAGFGFIRHQTSGTQASRHSVRHIHETRCLNEKTRSNKSYSVSSPPLVKLLTPEGRARCRTFAFCFDIDGVLYQGSNKIPATIPTMRLLATNGVRLVTLTNGGGGTVEDERAKGLQKKLGVPEQYEVFKGRVIQSHTPCRGWPEDVKNQTVYITGKDPEAARRIAHDYGFKTVVTSQDILRHNPTLYPFDHKLGKGVESSKGAPTGLPQHMQGWRADPFNHKQVKKYNAFLKIDKILIWNDPRDWSLDVQIIYDILISHKGYLGTVSNKNGDKSLPNNGWQQDGQPELWMSNLDLFWRTEYSVNRYGTGAFVEALKGVWSASTGGTPLQFSAMGKPFKESYDYAERLLLSDYQRQGLETGQKTPEIWPLKTVYMIGDNPESDIRGAGEYESSTGTQWVPVLVKTGVYQEKEGEPAYKPANIVNDVLDAVVWAMRREGIEVDRGMVEKMAKDEQWVIPSPPGEEEI